MAVFSLFLRSRLGLGDRFPWVAALALGTLGFSTVGLGPMAGPGVAQPIAALPSCAAPGPDEYLLLVVLQTEAAQSKLIETLPPSVKAPTCNYLGSRVARMGGFQKPEDADAWASYLRDVASLPAFVAKPTQGSTKPSPTAASPAALSPNNAATASASKAVQDPAALTAAAQSTATPAAPVAPSQSALPAQPQPTVLGSLAEPIAPPIETLPPPVPPNSPRIGAKIDVPVGGGAAGNAAIAPTPGAVAPAATQPPAPTEIGSQASAAWLQPAQITMPEPVIPATATVTAPPVTTPPMTTAPSNVPAALAQAITTPTASSSTVTTYQPKVLSPGYAVLLEYGNQTSIVPILRQLTKRPVGLASYGQRPYLLVNHTADSAVALATLKTLGNNGFRIMVVNSELVTQLTPDVQIQ